MSRVLGSGSGRQMAIAAFVTSCIVVPAVLVALAVRYEPELSPLDEVAHLDYVRRAEALGVPRMGDPLLDETAREAKCRQLETSSGTPCVEDQVEVRPADLVPDGYSYEAQHPPLYYWTSAALRQMTSFGPADSFITSARLTGAFWLSAGLICLWFALRRLSVGVPAAAASCVVVAASPLGVYQVATVTNDATSILAGSSMLLTYLWFRERVGPARLAAMAAMAALVVTLKPVNVLVVAAIAVVASFDLSRVHGWFRGVSHAAAPLFAGAAAYGAWIVIREARAIVPTSEVLGAVLSFKQTSEGLPVGQIVFSASRLLPAYEASSSLVLAYATTVALLVRLVIVAPAVLAALRPEPVELPALVGLSALAVAVVAGAAFNVQFWLEHELLGGPAARYGLSLLPLLVVPFAVRGSVSRRAVLGVCCVAAIASISLVTAIVQE